MKKFFFLLIVGFLSVLTNAQIIADHTVVDRYDDIPQNYLDSVKRMLVSIAGESHSSGYRIGMDLLEEMDGAFQAETFGDTPVPPKTDQYVRIGRHRAIGEDYFFSQSRIASMKAEITYQYNTGNPFNIMGFGWCWDMTDDNDPGGTEDPVYHVRWAGRSEGGPDGNMRWGLDSDDQVLTGNIVSMDTYLEAVEAYILHCKENAYPTKWIFTTGPVDFHGGTENGFQREIKQDHIRAYVAEDESRILFDYADILCWNDSAVQNLADWDDESNIRPHAQIHPDNMMDYDESWNLIAHSEDGDHIGEVGTIRLAKAMWWMLARIAGWEGVIVPVSGITISSEGGVGELYVDDTLRFTTLVTPADATYQEVAWSVTNGSGSAYINEDGLLTPGNPGTVTVVATAKDGSGVMDNFLLTIIEQMVPVSSITISSAGDITEIKSGTSLQFSATVLPDTATNKELDWSISNGTGTASISVQGLLTAANPGTVSVVATAQDGSGISGRFDLSITAPSIEVTSITISSEGDVSEIDEGEMLQLTAAVSPPDADNPSVFWHVTSAVNSLGAGSITEDGIFIAIAEGDVDVVATAQDGSSVNDLFTITILGPSVIGESESGIVILYPNPGNGLFYLNAGDLEIEVIQVVDAHGGIVLELAPGPGKQIIELDLSSQQSGLYIIKAKAGDQFIIRQAIMNR